MRAAAETAESTGAGCTSGRDGRALEAVAAAPAAPVARFVADDATDEADENDDDDMREFDEGLRGAFITEVVFGTERRGDREWTCA